MDDIDSAIDEAGGFKWYQLTLLLCCLVPASLVGANMGASVFVAMVPKARCRSPGEEMVIKDCPENFQSLLVPELDEGGLSLCLRYNHTSNNVSSMYSSTMRVDNATFCNISDNVESSDLIQCEDWMYERDIMRHTIVTDFHLVCGDSWAGYFAQSALMMGVGIGSVLAGTLSDKLGRRHAFLFSCVGSITFGVSLAFVHSYLAFCIVRAMLGFFAYSSFPVLFVLNSEMTTPRFRSVSGQILEFGFPFGFLYLSLVSYLTREWRKVQLLLTAPFAFGVLMWWFMPESPRWLDQENRKNEALVVIKKMAKVNRKEVKRERNGRIDLPGIIQPDMAPRMDDDVVVVDPSGKETQHDLSQALKYPGIRCACIKLSYVWFCVSCVYYGLTLNAADFGQDPFANLCLSSVGEIVGCITAVPLLNIAGRKLTFCTSAILAGVFCMIIVFAPAEGALAVSILGKLSISIAFGATYVHTNEVFPTPIRTSAISVCNAMARLGGVLSPLIAMSGIAVTELPYILFGVLAISAGALVLTLPETRGVSLPQTLQDGEEFISRYRGLKSLCGRSR